MSKLNRKLISKNVLIVLITTAILVALLIFTNSTALAFISGKTNSTELSNADENYQFGYEEEGVTPPAGTTDIRGASTTDGRFIMDVSASSEDNQCSVNIPTGTIGLTEDLQPLTEVSIVPMETPPEPPEDTSIIGIPYDFGPDGATFDPPITITITYDPADIPADVDINDLQIAMYALNPLTGQMEWTVLTNIHVDPVTHTISGDTGHFTVFAIIVAAPAPTTPAPVTPSPVNWNLIIGLVAAAVVVAVVIIYFLRRRWQTA